MDLDHDGWLDLVQTNGWEGHNGRDDPEWASETTRVFRNLTAVSPELTFADVAEQAGLVHRGQGRGLVHLDYDNDGDQDLVIFNNGGLPTLVRNELDPGSDGSGHWLRVFPGYGSACGSRARRFRQPGRGARRRSSPSALRRRCGRLPRSVRAVGPLRSRRRAGGWTSWQVHWADGSTSTYHQVPTNRTLTITARQESVGLAR